MTDIICRLSQMKFDVEQAKVKGPRQLNFIMDALT